MCYQQKLIQKLNVEGHRNRFFRIRRVQLHLFFRKTIINHREFLNSIADCEHDRRVPFLSNIYFFFGKIKKREWRTDGGAQKINN